MIDRLLHKYEELFDTNTKSGQPDWAVKKTSEPNSLVHPTIPFVGKHYFEQPIKILLYASAENLANYSGRLDDDEKAKNRHRFNYNDSIDKYFFPIVHIAPMEDGCLMNVLKYVSEKIGASLPDNPSEFLECIAFGNFCKFSIEAPINIDYPNDIEKLSFSIPYVLTDLEMLKPDLIIMPKSIYYTVRQLISHSIEGVHVLPISQINARTINCHISKDYAPKEKSELSPTVREWYEALGDTKNKKVAYANRIGSKTKSNFLSVFTYLDEVISTTMGTTYLLNLDCYECD